jgi:hypothetical protein
MDSDLHGITPQPPPQQSEWSEGVTLGLLKTLRAHGIGADNAIAQDLLARREAGMEKYGTELMTFNGRDSEVDAYQELLDAVVYYTQFRMEWQKGHGEDNFAIATTHDALIDLLITVRGSLNSRQPKDDGPKIIL